MSITMKKIAELAEVNISTVSRALNNDPAISLSVRKKIFDLASKHNYQKRNSTKTKITYVIDKKFFLMSSNFYNRIIESIESEAIKNGYSFQLSLVDPNSFSIENFHIKDLAGIIVTSWRFDKFIEDLLQLDIPALFIDFYQPNIKVPAILSDKIDGVFSGIEYLYSLGHQRIIYILGDSTLWCAQDRLTGYQRAVKFFNLDSDDTLIMNCNISIESSYEVMKRYLRTEKKIPTAVMAANDLVAIGAVQAIKELDYRIPEDISVLGYDDIDLSNEVVPKISTMQVNKKKMGKLAVQQIIRLIKKKEIDFDKLVIRPELIIRDSTGPALRENLKNKEYFE